MGKNNKTVKLHQAMKLLQIQAYLVLALVFISTSCLQAQKTPAQPTQLNLKEVIDKASKVEGLTGLILSKQGKIIGEKYFHTQTRQKLNEVRSVTKSIMSLLIGIAIDQQLIKSVDDPIGKYLGDMKGYAKRRHGKITVRHLLTMSSGIDWDESSVTLHRQWRKEPITALLERPIAHKPGTKFYYSTAASYLLSVILTKASGMPTLAFAQRNFFRPLGIQQVQWEKLGGYYHGGSRLRLKPRDMLRIGELMLNDGAYQGKQIIPRKWVQEATRLQISINKSTSYGYLWWSENSVPDKNFGAVGYGGQFIVVFPTLKLIIVTTAFSRGIGVAKAAKQEHDIGQLIGKTIYPFLKQ
ncbi:MAG TPA: hypothetical protein DCS93_01510 [Microscillaceae bacterium]|nr:hypothetical protein [Microscillaceae bacterium]